MVNRKVFFIKFVHSILFWLLTFCLFYILYGAITKTYDWTVLAAILIIFVEGMSLVFNHGRCPLTTLAEKYGAENGAVTHLFMPEWMARQVFRFFGVMFVIEIIWISVGYWG